MRLNLKYECIMEILRNDYVEQLYAMSWNGKRNQAQYEIDFVVNTGTEQIYIQSALNVDTKDKLDQETFSLRNTQDSFRKMLILDSNELPWINEEGITFVGVIPFLLENLL